MSIVELRPQLHRILLGSWQAYLWRDGDSVTLIDTGALGSGPAIAEGLAEIGLGPSNVERVVLTHFHSDHVGSAAEIGSWGSAEIVAHALDAPMIRGERPGPPPNFADWERKLHDQVAAGLLPAPATRVDREVRDGDVLDFGGGAHIIASPGHTDGSLAVYLPAHKVLFTGDIVAEYQGGVILGVFNLDTVETATSFRRLAELDVEVACFGHGEPILERAGARLRAAASQLTS